jgi:2,5-diamino-6-(ribosylamino)-4(3H)-pyrimidinone 5'-phosphate reductase
VDALHAAADAIMVGGRTLIEEDPRLTVRSAELVAARRQRGREPQPTRVGVVSALPDPRTGADLRDGSRFLHGEPSRVVVFTTERTTHAARQRLEAAGTEVVVLGARRVDLASALRHLFRTGVNRLLVEGGGTLVGALLRERLVDEVQLFVAPMIVGGSEAPTPVEGPGFDLDDAIHVQLAGSSVLDDHGVVLRYLVGSPDRAPAKPGTGAPVRARSA